MMLREILLNSPFFIFENSVFYQKDFGRYHVFGESYLTLRNNESRLYSDEIIHNLPDIPPNHSLMKEWTARKITMNKLLKHLNSRKITGQILEVGCGNGWLSRHLASLTGADVVALDVNEHELLQGARLFSGKKNLTFVFGDIFTIDITKQTFDTIILASSVQYFRDVQQLLSRLLELLKPSGEIHIVDSPWYNSKEKVNAAKARSAEYFLLNGAPAMTEHYFHHAKNELSDFNQRTLFDPRSLKEILRRKILKKPQMAFPWILITYA